MTTRRPVSYGVEQKYQQLIDGLRLLRLLAVQPLSPNDTKAHGLHRRTFYRYLQAFQRAGIPIQPRFNKGRPGQEYGLKRKDWAALLTTPQKEQGRDEHT
jgi:hypothetical protein